MKKFALKTIIITLCLLNAVQSINAQTTAIKYLNTNSLIANPDRGWYADYYTFSNYLSGSYRPLNADELRENREQKHITLILRLFYLHQFFESDNVSSEYIAKMQADFDAIRQAGVKCIVRFAYSDSQNAAIYDATPEKVLSHINSLGNVLADNSDIILCVQAGFVGAWGEWYYTKNFAGAGYVPSAIDQANRRAVVEALLGVLPDNVQVQVRTPAIKQAVVGNNVAIYESEAYNGTNKSRIAHHNDCFLANGTDYGTYTNLTADLEYLNQETKYAIAGGETCDASNATSDCENSVQRMELLHWTYLNSNYNKDVYEKWRNQNCIDNVNIKLGYRIYLDSCLLPNSATAGHDINVTFYYANVGFAAPVQYKTINILLINTLTSKVWTLPYSGTNDDTRFWFPGNIVSTGKITLPDTLPSGNYSMQVRFADQNTNLAKQSSYCIQLANVATWDNETGANKLNHILAVDTNEPTPLPDKPNLVSANVVSENQVDVTWLGANNNITGFELYRCLNNNNNWELLAVLPVNVFTYSDKQLTPGTKYSYVLRAVNSYTASGWSNIITASTLGTTAGFELFNSFNIYPNPLHSQTLFVNNPLGKNAVLSIVNSNGKIVFSQPANNSQFVVNNLCLIPGTYVVNITLQGLSVSKKLVIE